MKNNNLEFQGISESLKYIFTNKGIIPTSDFFNDRGQFIDYSHENLTLAVDIMREHKEIYYKLNQISLVEYANSSRKFLYELIEIYQPENSITVIKEWEEKFGSKLLLLNESVDKLIVESRVQESWQSIKVILEQWWNPLSSDFVVYKGAKNVYDWGKEKAGQIYDWGKEQVKQIGQKGIIGWAADKAKAVWNKVKNAVVAAWDCLTGNFVECLMEGIRSAAFSAIGMGVMTLLTFIPGVGQVADVIVYGSLLIWDVYKMLSGNYESGRYQWSFLDIIIDAVCIALPALGFAFRGAGAGIKTAEQLGTAAATKGGVFAKVVSTLKGTLGKILEWIGKGASWIGEKLGITWLSKFGTKTQNFIKQTTEASVKVAESKGATLTQKVGTRAKEFKQGVTQFTKDFKFTKPLPVVAKSTGKTVMLTAGLCAALGLDGLTCKEKVENGEVTQEQLEAAEAEIQQNLSKSIEAQGGFEDLEFEL